METDKLKKTQITQETIQVMVWDIVVGKRYYSFHYRFYRDGKWTGGQYDSSHSRSPATIRKLLKNGYAIDIVLEHYIIKYH
jgi:hypothetical protein